MSILAERIQPLAVDVICTEVSLCVILADGREISVPIVWFPKLKNAHPEQRKNWRFIGGGVGIHWKDVDEDISVETLLSVRSEIPAPA